MILREISRDPEAPRRKLLSPTEFGKQVSQSEPIVQGLFYRPGVTLLVGAPGRRHPFGGTRHDRPPSVLDRGLLPVRDSTACDSLSCGAHSGITGARNGPLTPLSLRTTAKEASATPANRSDPGSGADAVP
jgi:hypothetical protein